MASKKSDQLADELAEPFAPHELYWTVPDNEKPNGKVAACVATVQPICIVERLNSAAGIGGWSDHYSVLSPTEVECRLTIRVDGEAVVRAGVGMGAAGTAYRILYADALRAAAFRFGVGFYLMRLPPRMMGEIDPATRKVLVPPILPRHAIPEKWLECGKQYANQLQNMLNTVARESNTPVETVRDRLYNNHGVGLAVALEKVAKCHAADMLQDLNTWITELAKRKAATDGARAGAEKTPVKSA